MVHRNELGLLYTNVRGVAWQVITVLEARKNGNIYLQRVLYG